MKSLQILATFSEPLKLSKPSFEDILENIIIIIIQTHEESLRKAALEALYQIGLFVGNTNDTDKQMSYKSIVIEKILLLLSPDDLEIPLKWRLDAVYLVGSTNVEYMMRLIDELEHTIFFRFIESHVCGYILCAKSLLSWQNWFSVHISVLMLYRIYVRLKIGSSLFSC